MISQNFGKFCEKMIFKTLILGPSRKVNFVLYSVFLFVWVKRSTLKLKLTRISKFKMVTKKFDEFVIFHQFFLAEVCNWAQVLLQHSRTLKTLVNTKTKCINLVSIRKNNTCTSCVFNDFKYILSLSCNATHKGMVACLCHFVISLFVFSHGVMARRLDKITPSEKTK